MSRKIRIYVEFNLPNYPLHTEEDERRNTPRNHHGPPVVTRIGPRLRRVLD